MSELAEALRWLVTVTVDWTRAHPCLECGSPVRPGLVVCAGLSPCWKAYVAREAKRLEEQGRRIAARLVDPV